MSILGPTTRSWSGTFGAYELCRYRGNRAIVLDGVRFKSPRGLTSRGEPIPWVRTVMRGQFDQDNDGFTPFYSAMGSPPAFNTPDVPIRPRGAFARGVHNVVVNQRCTKDDHLNRGFQELLISAEGGGRGLQVTHTLVDYHVGAKRYTLEMDWIMTWCGSDSRLDEPCRRGD